MSAPTPTTWKVENLSESPITLHQPLKGKQKPGAESGRFLNSVLMKSEKEPNVRFFPHEEWMQMIEHPALAAMLATGNVLRATPIYG